MRGTRQLTAFAVAAVVGGAALGACSAGGTTTGGEAKFDAAMPVPPAIDASAEGSVPEDAGPPTWSTLYADIFGNAPNGPGCAGDGACHGAADQPGAQSSNYICPVNAKDDCYKSISATGPTAANLLNQADPEHSGLIQILRHNENGVQIGSMPKRPATYFFSDAQIARIKTWMANGGKND